MFEDKTLICADCGGEFVFTAGEQEFYHEKGFQNEPKRCKDCRLKRRSGGNERKPRQMYEVTCARCGVKTEIPFQPVEDRPVYCLECFRKIKDEEAI